jgi:opacity protein-like surface antigen
LCPDRAAAGGLAKRLCATLLALALASPACAASASQAVSNPWNPESPYPADILNTKYMSAVKALIDSNVVTGDEDGLFHPEKSINRAEFAAIVARATHQQNVDTSQPFFTDLAGYGWAEQYINRCHEQGWIRGVGGTSFAPGKEVSYAEAVTVLIRVQRGQQEELLGAWPDSYIQYADMYNLLGSVEVTDWGAPALKGDIALLTNRMVPQPQMAPATAYAMFGNVVVTGQAGIPIEPQSLVIDVSNDTFLNIYQGTDVTGWFMGLSTNGLTATVKARVVEGMSRVSIEIEGTPLQASSAQLSAVVPAGVMKNGRAITVSTSAKSVFDIY